MTPLRPRAADLVTHLRHAVPAAMLLAVVLVSMAPLSWPNHVLLAPGLIIATVFFWSVHRPDLLRPWHNFAIGIVADALSGAAIGIHACVLTAINAGVVAQNTFFRGKPFTVVWFTFALVAPAALLTLAALQGIAARVAIDPLILGLQIALTIFLYPPFAWLLGTAQRAFLPAT
jgi:rod shape-determining protein MreD